VGFAVTNVPVGYQLTGWSGCVQSPSNGNAASIASVTAPGTCAATYFGRWARSYGVEGAREGTVGLLSEGDRVILVGETQTPASRAPAPHVTLLEGMSGEVRRSVLLDGLEGQLTGVLATAMGPTGAIVASTGPTSSRTVTEIDDRLVTATSWRLTYPRPSGGRLAVTGSSSGPRTFGLAGNSDIRKGRLQFLSTRQSFDICEDTTTRCAPNGSCLATCDSCQIFDTGPIIDVGAESVVAFQGHQDGNLVVARLKEASLVWIRRIDFERDAVTPTALLVNGNELIVAGYVTKPVPQHRDAFVAKLDVRDGARLDAFTFAVEGTGREEFTAVSVDARGRYLFTGTINDVTSPAGTTDVWLVRFDGDLKSNVVQAAFGGPQNETGAGAHEVPSGDVVLAGTTASFGEQGDHWAMLLSESLNITFSDTNARRRTTNAASRSSGVSVEGPTCYYAQQAGDDIAETGVRETDVSLKITPQAPGQ
jgi:hypothetical protein